MFHEITLTVIYLTFSIGHVLLLPDDHVLLALNPVSLSRLVDVSNMNYSRFHCLGFLVDIMVFWNYCPH